MEFLRGFFVVGVVFGIGKMGSGYKVVVVGGILEFEDEYMVVEVFDFEIGKCIILFFIVLFWNKDWFLLIVGFFIVNNFCKNGYEYLFLCFIFEVLYVFYVLIFGFLDFVIYGYNGRILVVFYLW